jgi:hypothetical protein
MPLSSLIAIANFKAILDFIKDFQICLLRLVAILIISETFFWWDFVLRKQDCKRTDKQEQESVLT